MNKQFYTVFGIIVALVVISKLAIDFLASKKELKPVVSNLLFSGVNAGGIFGTLYYFLFSDETLEKTESPF